MTPVKIAIDGPSGAGKSTMAKIIAKELGITYLDTGSMYRAVALKAIRSNIDTHDREGVSRIIQETSISVTHDNGVQKIFLDGEDVTSLIRSNDVSMGASDVSAFPEVREKLVELQRRIAEKEPVVMDGRDIGTHVLPDADVKIFLTASVEERARRRYEELAGKGMLDKSFEELMKEIAIRDHNDSTREFSPLRKAEDAIEMDTTDLDVEQSAQRILELIRKRLG